MRSLKTRLLAFIGTIFFSFIGFVMPMRMKRLVAMTTLQIQLTRDGIFKEEAIEKLNRVMRLARSDKALLLPAELYSTVWDETTLHRAVQEALHGKPVEACEPEEARRFGEAVLPLMPSWLRYGRSRDDQLKDLIDLFNCQHVQMTAA